MTIERCAVLAFMTSVTCYLLGRVLAGAVSLTELVVYGAAAAMGMEFLIRYWRTVLGRP
jgi:ABC-type arginine/histidine transport system permease subunit